MEWIQSGLSLLIVATLVLSAVLSIRYRRQREPRLRGLYAAHMNISMGAMLIIVAVSQLFFFTDSNVRRIFGIVCVLLGLFNLFAGLRNRRIYSQQ
jgi:hypothetical protein